MDNEAKHFYFIIGMIFIFMGVTALIYGFIIPSQVFTRNVLPSLIFIITGIILIVIGTSLAILLRKADHDIADMEQGGLDS